MSMDEGASDSGADDFHAQIAAMTPQQLRDQFKSEANSHRAMLQRASKDPTLVVAPDWRPFRNFLRDMGRVPVPGWTLDRIDAGRREYGPGLCRWADKKTQSENRSNTRWVPFGDGFITGAELSRRSGRPPSSVYAALDAGQSAEEILSPEHGNKYRPQSAGDDREAEAWRADYRKWLNGEVHQEKRAYAPPEVYDLIRTSLEAARADRELTARGYYELDASEEAEWSALMNSTAGQTRWTKAPAQADHALKSLWISNPKLADRLTGRAGYHLLTYFQWAEFLSKRPA